MSKHENSSAGGDHGRQFNAGLIEAAIRRHVDHRANTLIPEASIRYAVGHSRFEYRADFVVVTRANYATELEVKISLGDWRRDLAKPKWVGMPAWITRFIYVVPQQLGIPEWVPERAGVWHVKPTRVQSTSTCLDGFEIFVARAPHVLGREKLPPAVLGTWHKNLYYRYWEQRMDAQRRIARHIREAVA
ncbi:hypothetical protein G3N59_01160 [Paraburkholderia sp. Ac-20340]|uniref:hypothetical protein n=1 Tax=Paraburkholderia sp. Ac-20340 TaxID=2703888 RepID=UPI00197EE574|nr:hypothetical protein [Paraburkholderia sp. Ac-20340]MBN3851976.1 hypothetical protein [Paraburkholderia sp. Ac-20340]